MKVAIGAMDERRLFAGHFGESPVFLVVDLERTGGGARERRSNPWCAEPIATRPPKIAALLADCDAIAVRSIAKEGLQALSRRFTVYLAPSDRVDALLAALGSAGLAGLRRFDPGRGKFVAGGD